ncbi:unnamed protein product, partial [Ixodes pacificus]
VNVTVFYESYSRDSKRFVTRQLWPTYRRLRDHVSIELVPYGNARMRGSTSDGWPATFVCRHGDPECLADILHTCAIALYPNTSLHLKFIACTLRNHDPASAVWKCAGDVMDMVPQKIMSCVNSLQGKRLFQRMGTRTSGIYPPITRFPSVAFNGYISPMEQRQIQHNLKASICGHFKSPVPRACQLKAFAVEDE